jgi:hypothetical protein
VSPAARAERRGDPRPIADGLFDQGLVPSAEDEGADYDCAGDTKEEDEGCWIVLEGLVSGLEEKEREGRGTYRGMCILLIDSHIRLRGLCVGS